MLARATDQLDARSVPHRTVGADLADELPPGRYDAVVSALAIHHLDDAGKRALYRRAAAGWHRAGCSSTPSRSPARPRSWTGATTRCGWQRIAELGASPDEIAASRERMRHDRPATVADQCRWLAEAGLVDVDCYFKEWRFAVFGGRAG